ncbi:hypothetical protein E4T39_06690 [Aureobasidium subglaciale]|nr:hypothetical protein E4T39_06690 [Aureobasidium subglaciale]
MVELAPSSCTRDYINPAPFTRRHKVAIWSEPGLCCPATSILQQEINCASHLLALPNLKIVIQTRSSEQKGGHLAISNTTGQVTVAELISMARRIAGNLEEVPSTIYRFFRLVIIARSHSYEMIQELAATHSNAEIEASNVTQKRFFDKLEEALRFLEAESASRKQDARRPGRGGTSHLLQPFLATHATRFSARHERQRRLPYQTPINLTVSHEKASAKSSSEPIVEDVPLEGYCIIDGPDDLITDYCIAVTP